MPLVETGTAAAGDTWHICLEGLKEVGTLCYGWRAEADAAWGGGSRFHPGGTEHPFLPRGGLLLHQLSRRRTPDGASVHLGIACMCPMQQIMLTAYQQCLPHAVPCRQCVRPASSQEGPSSHPWLLPWCGMRECGGMAGLTRVGVVLQGRSCWTPTAPS